MTVIPLVADAPIAPRIDRAAEPHASRTAFGDVLDDVGATLNRASGAEDRFAHGAGSLFDAVYERARADVALSVAAAAVQRVASAVQTLTNMQV